MDHESCEGSTMCASESDSQRRKQILCAAERLLKHYGFQKTTISDIAREAKVGVGTVYLEFSSKDEILAELSFKRHSSVLEAMSKAKAMEGSFTERLPYLLNERVQTFIKVAQDGQHGLDLLKCACMAVHQVHEKFRHQEEMLLAEFLRAAHQAGEFDVPQPEDVARIILAIYDRFFPSYGIALQQGDETSLKQLKRDLDLTHRIILSGLLKR